MKTTTKALMVISLLYFTACEKEEESDLKTQETLQSQPKVAALGEWTRKPDFPGERPTSTSNALGYVGFQIAGKMYVGDIGNFFYEFDPATDTWTKKAAPPTKRQERVAFGIGNYGYIGLGHLLGCRTRQFFKYNPLTNTWSSIADCPVEPGEEGSVAFSIGNKGYVLGGYADNKIAFYEYNPDTDVWTKKAGYPVPIEGHPVAFSIGSKGYVGTDWAYSNEFYEYDPATNVWTKKANFAGEGRSWTVGFGIGNKGYIGTGFRANAFTPYTIFKDFWEYDPTADTWTLKAPLAGSARYGALGVAIGDKAYVGFGQADVAFSRDLWEFDPSK
ncbi:MAG: type sorting protein [Sphingobacteriales bacterium]|nr:type sorting protein [Sphingobacteriales bacterium]